jgi:predicted membrane chloride channel (bestrophin family)
MVLHFVVDQNGLTDLTISGYHPTFSVPPIPCLSSVLIALLLSYDTEAAYEHVKEGRRHRK